MLLDSNNHSVFLRRYNTINRISTNTTKEVGIDTINRICLGLNCRPEEFIKFQESEEERGKRMYNVKEIPVMTEEERRLKIKEATAFAALGGTEPRKEFDGVRHKVLKGELSSEEAISFIAKKIQGEQNEGSISL